MKRKAATLRQKINQADFWARAARSLGDEESSRMWDQQKAKFEQEEARETQGNA